MLVDSGGLVDISGCGVTFRIPRPSPAPDMEDDRQSEPLIAETEGSRPDVSGTEGGIPPGTP